MNKSNSTVVQPDLNYYYRNSGVTSWSPCLPSEVEGLRSGICGDAPQYITWAATDYREGMSKDAAIYAANFIPLDIDQSDIMEAILSARTVRDKLRDLMGQDFKSCRLFASGGKGFHIELPEVLFGVPLNHRLLNQAGKKLCQYLGGRDLGLDEVIYSRGQGRMWREANVQRENGRFKVPLAWDALDAMTLETHDEAVSQPRERAGTWSTPHSKNEGLASAWATFMQEAAKDNALTQARRREAKSKQADPDELFEIRVQCALDWLAENHADAFCDYAEWKRVLLALHVYDWEAEAIKFSKSIPGWNERDFEQQWHAIDGKGADTLTPATIIHEARQLGWSEGVVLDSLRPKLEGVLVAAESDASALYDKAFLDILAYLKKHHAGAYAQVTGRPAMKGHKQGIGRALKGRAEEKAPPRESQMQKAHRVIATIGGDDLLFDGVEFWQYNRIHWAPLKNDQPIRQAIHVMLGNAHFSAAEVQSLVRLIETESYRAGVTFDQKYGEVVALSNGELRLDGGEWTLNAHKRDSWLTSTIPHKWNPDAKCPEFFKFLASVFEGDADADAKARIVTELIGATLTPSTRFEKGLILLGATGRNGKSTLLKVLEAVVGKANCSNLSLGRLGDRFSVAQLRGKHANIIGEVTKGEGMPDGLIKQITSGDTLHGEYKGRDGFSFSPFAKLWIAANILPSQRDCSAAILSRFELIEFNRQFLPGQGQDHDLSGKLAAEAEGIIVAALTAYSAAVDRGHLIIPESSAGIKEAWRRECDPVADFTADCLDIQSSADSDEAFCGSWRASSRALQDAYAAWCLETNTRIPMSSGRLGQRLKQILGVKDSRWVEKGLQVRGYTGLRVRPVS